MAIKGNCKTAEIMVLLMESQYEFHPTGSQVLGVRVPGDLDFFVQDDNLDKSEGQKIVNDQHQTYPMGSLREFLTEFGFIHASTAPSPTAPYNDIVCNDVFRLPITYKDKVTDAIVTHGIPFHIDIQIVRDAELKALAQQILIDSKQLENLFDKSIRTKIWNDTLRAAETEMKYVKQNN